MSYRGTVRGHTDTFIHKEEEGEAKKKDWNSKQCERHRGQKCAERRTSSKVNSSLLSMSLAEVKKCVREGEDKSQGTRALGE